MSNFAGLNIAYTGLNAARAALEVTGQNVANANTVGYSRQRVDQTPMAQAALTTYMAQNSIGDGVQITGISRVTDSVVNARVNTSASTSAYWDTAATALSSVETSLNEPSTDGLSGVLNKFWSTWQAMATNTNSQGQANTLIAQGSLVATAVSTGYTAATDAWSDAQKAAGSTVATINATAANIADLNTSIRSLAAGGGNVNSLLDQRDAAVTTMAKLTGATTRNNADGTIDVVIGGNTIVSSITSTPVKLSGANNFSLATSTTSPNDPVKLVWTKPDGTDGAAVSLDGGEMAARIAALQPANATGTGGVYAEAANSYNVVAKAVADQVNAIHTQGSTSTGATGADFFSYTSGDTAALSLKVVPTTISGIALYDTAGNLSNTVADKISQIGTSSTAPDTTWATYVAQIGSQSATATARATSADSAATAATTAQTSVSGVDLDEETANLVVFQHAYQASARVISTIDAVLDSLLNMGAR